MTLVTAVFGSSANGLYPSLQPMKPSVSFQLNLPALWHPAIFFGIGMVLINRFNGAGDA
ncbi:MAG: hypothetical protein H7334_06945 [Ferruginibacter sp.]|nr:hypothetical protein [Ferruginibacter sp.]